jgi:cytochrome c oxidase cbb3-type subunit 3
MSMRSAPLLLIFTLCFTFRLQARQHQPTPPKEAANDAEVVQRGRAYFQSSCGFCHGSDATGSRAPDLVRSGIVSHDDHGNLLAPFIRTGRPDKGMPAFPSMKDDQMLGIVAFLHHQAEAALHSTKVPGDYPLAKLLTGNADTGKRFFNGAGECSRCHSPTGDLAGIAKKFTPVDLQQRFVYPLGKNIVITATVTTGKGEQFQGKVVNDDEFNIGIECQDGRYRSWPRDRVKVALHDPLQKHRELTTKYSDADVHNLFAYLETLK